jgi:hypothetical protein
LPNITIDDGFIVNEDTCIAFPCHAIQTVFVFEDGGFGVAINAGGAVMRVAEGLTTRQEACEELHNVLQTLRRECK